MESEFNAGKMSLPSIFEDVLGRFNPLYVASEVISWCLLSKMSWDFEHSIFMNCVWELFGAGSSTCFHFGNRFRNTGIIQVWQSSKRWSKYMERHTEFLE